MLVRPRVLVGLQLQVTLAQHLGSVLGVAVYELCQVLVVTACVTCWDCGPDSTLASDMMSCAGDTKKKEQILFVGFALTDGGLSRSGSGKMRHGNLRYLGSLQSCWLQSHLLVCKLLHSGTTWDVAPVCWRKVDTEPGAWDVVIWALCAHSGMAWHVSGVCLLEMSWLEGLVVLVASLG